MTDESAITVRREIPASSKAIFEVISLPSRHPELDASGFVRSDERTDRITEVGQTFRMNMAGDHMGGEYQTDNLVTGFDPDKMIAWKTAPAGQEPPGWEWLWELKAQGPDSTEVTLTYDWSKVDEQFRKKISFPLVPESALEDSLGRLASAVS